MREKKSEKKNMNEVGTTGTTLGLNKLTSRRDFIKMAGIAGAGAVALGITGCTTQGGATSTITNTVTNTVTQSPTAKVFTWRVQTHLTPSETRYRIGFADLFPKLIDARTNGRIKLQMFASGQLAQPADELTSLGQGVFEAIVDSPSYLGGQVPCSAIEWGLPGAYQAVYDCQYVFDRGLEDIMRQAYATFNAYYVTPLYGSIPEATPGILSKKPIPNLAAAKGILLRSPGGAGSDWFKAMGFVPVSMPMSDIFTGLSLGTIDAAWTGIAAMDSMGVTKVTPYYFDTGSIGGVDSNVMVNADVWKTDSADLQQAFIAACKEYGRIHTGLMFADAMQGQAVIKAKNIQKQVWPAEDWAQAVKLAQQLWTKYDKSSDANTVKAIKVLRDYIAWKESGMSYP